MKSADVGSVRKRLASMHTVGGGNDNETSRKLLLYLQCGLGMVAYSLQNYSIHRRNVKKQ